MKLLAVFFVLGLAIAAALPVAFDDIETDIDEISDELGDEFIVYAEGGLADRLRARIEEYLEKLKKAFDNGEGIDKNLFKKAEDFYQKLKNYGVELSEKFKQIFEDLRSKIAGNSPVEQAEFNIKDILRRLRDKIREKIDADKLKELVEKYFGKRSELADQLLELLKTKGEKAKNKILEFIDKIIGDDAESYADAEGGLLQRIKERLENIITRMKKNFDDGRGVRGNLMKKAEDVYQKFKNMGGELSEKIKSIFEDLRNKMSRNSPVEQAEFNIKDILRRLRDKIREKVDADKLKELVEKYFGKRSELADKLLELLKTKGESAKTKILDFIDKLIGDDAESYADSEGGLMQRIKERLETMIEKMKKSFDDGKGVRGDLMKKAEDVYQKFKNLGGELSEKIKNIFEDLRSKVSRTRSVENADFMNIIDMFRKLKKMIRDKVDAETLKAKVESMFGKGNELAEQLINMLKDKGEKGKNKILELIDRILGEKEEKRSIKEVYEKIKNYFKDLNIELKEKFTKFGEYAKEQYQKVLEKGKTRAENLKKIAKEFLDDSKKMSKEVAEEALEFFREYKEDLGNVFEDVKGKVREILKKKEEKRSIKEVYEKIKNYFKDLNIELKEKFTKFGEYAKEQYQKVLEKGKTRAENLKKIAREFLDDTKNFSKDIAEEALEFFREYKEDLGNVYDDVKQKVRDILKRKEEKRSIKDTFEKIKNYFKDLNIELKEKFSKFGEYVKEHYHNMFEQGKTRAENLKKIAQEFLEDLHYESKKINKKVTEEALEFFREYKEDLGNVWDDLKEKARDLLKKNEDKRSIKEVYERIKNYFKDLNIELKEKFTKFGEYAKEQYQKVLEQGKTRAENLRKIAREFLDDSRKMSKEVAEEALGFFREYKEDLGSVFDDVREKVREILKKNE